jgi:hypothetical protein
MYRLERRKLGSWLSCRWYQRGSAFGFDSMILKLKVSREPARVCSAYVLPAVRPNALPGQ